MNTGWRLILRSLIQFAAGGFLTIPVDAILRAVFGAEVDPMTLVAANTFLIIVLQNLAENHGIEWASPVKRPDKV